jgi:dienelactone hydrolase
LSGAADRDIHHNRWGLLTFDNPRLGPNPHRIAEALGGRGATTQYDPAAAEDSVRRLHEFLVTHLGN